MRTLQRKPCLRVVECARSPVGDAVANRAFFRIFSGAHELAAVDIFVTFVTHRRSLCETRCGIRSRVHRSQACCGRGGCRRFGNNRPMAPNTRYGLVRPLQDELGGVVIEGAQGLPLPRVVAGFASLSRIVRIGVASGAVLHTEVILPRRDGNGSLQGLVAIGADDRQMRSGERELRLLVFVERECRRMEHSLGMAGFAFVPVRLRRELSAMRIVVAALACRRREFVLGVRTSGLMARGAHRGFVLSLQLERAFLVILQGVKRRLEALLVMAASAIAACCARGELALMDVLVAVSANRMWNGLTEIAAGVALEAGDIAVFAQQRKLCTPVIEACIGF